MAHKKDEPLEKEEQKNAPELPEESTADVSEEPTQRKDTESPSDANRAESSSDNTEEEKNESSLEDKTQAAPTEQPRRAGIKAFYAAYWRKKKWTLPVTFVAIVLIILAVPFTRYKVLGLFLQKQVHVVVMDNTTHTPVSGATVQLGGKTFKTEGSGEAAGNVKVGPSQLTVTKQYYKSASQKVVVGLSGNSKYTVSLQATGRQVPIKVVNKVTGKGVEGATLKVLDTEAKTDKAGNATIVVPTDTKNPQATISLNGYNTLTTAIQITDSVVEANTFSVVPAGRLYFLSNKSGKLDVVKTNLDGSDRQTVLAGTGNEDNNNTSLLASRDWKYLALLSRRNGDTASVYLIDTTKSDKLTTIDEGDATFALSGWSDNTFVYQVSRNNAQPDQSVQAIKSFNAATGKLLTLDQTASHDTEPSGRQSSSSIYLIDSQVIYGKNWSPTSFLFNFAARQAELLSISTDGTNKKTIRGFSVATGAKPYSIGVDLVAYEPRSVYVHFNDGVKDSYYEYEDAKLNDKNLTAEAFWNTPYPTFLQSPNGNQTFWSEPRDGKNTLFIGDKDAKSKKEIASGSEYAPFGWFSDTYTLVSKSSSELYIMPADGSKTPLKITDYYKPAIDYRGYGGGYGGL